ncbi:protein of unknown function [Ruminococcaceae bacterium BL-6]|nr:protein of unknown function [Ruminococcaceae bacterium BL-6]
MRSVTSESYIVVNGRKRYLEESFTWLSYLMEDSEEAILTLHESKLITDQIIKIPKCAIIEYGCVD